MIRLEKFDEEGNEVAHIEFGHGTVGFVEMWYKDNDRVGVSFVETEPREIGVEYPVPDDYVPQVIISFNDAEGIDILIDTLNDCKRRIQGLPDMKDYILLSKPNYKSKDGTVKQGVLIDGKYYAPKSEFKERVHDV